MFIDAQQQFSDKQAVTSTGYSTNSVEIPPGLNAGIDMAAQIIVRSESGTNPTLTVELETSADDSTYTKLVGIKKPDGDKVFNIALEGTLLTSAFFAFLTQYFVRNIWLSVLVAVLIGMLMTFLPTTFTNVSGELPAISISSLCKNTMYCEGFVVLK